MNCPYCESYTGYEKICLVCEADLTKKRPEIKTTISEDEAFLPQPVLATYHTYDLLILLQYVRKERTEAYNLMQKVRKAPESVSVPSETISFAGEEYRHYTTRMKVLEGILIDRLGYKPKRVDDKLLSSLKSKMSR